MHRRPICARLADFGFEEGFMHLPGWDIEDMLESLSTPDKVEEGGDVNGLRPFDDDLEKAGALRVSFR